MIMEDELIGVKVNDKDVCIDCATYDDVKNAEDKYYVDVESTVYCERCNQIMTRD
jgi:hypothetical protein